MRKVAVSRSVDVDESQASLVSTAHAQRFAPHDALPLSLRTFNATSGYSYKIIGIRGV